MKRNDQGEWPVRFRFGKGRTKRLELPAALSEPEAKARYKRMQEIAKTVRVLPYDVAVAILRKAAAVETAQLGDIMGYAREQAKQEQPEEKDKHSTTFEDLAEKWLSNELNRQWPDKVKAKSFEAERGMLEVMRPWIGKIPLHMFRLTDAERVMRLLPGRLQPATRRHYAHFISRVFRLAVYPCGLLEHSPIKEGFVPRLPKGKAKSFLYPDEDAQLLTSNVPFERRFLYGVLAREGMRLGEALRLTVGDLDLKRGTLILDKNKTDEPRAWKLSDSVVRTFQLVLEGRGPEELVFQHPGGRHPAETFRADLKFAGIERPELFMKTDKRIPIRVHDLRSTFIVLALAQEKSETWISDRTGHTTSAMIRRYDRAARRVSEQCAEPLGDLDKLLCLHQNLHQKLSVVS